MPRLVFDRVQAAVASTAARMVDPSGRVPALEVAARGDVSRLRRADLQQARKLCRGRHLVG
jgi:hypothetical protein